MSWTGLVVWLLCQYGVLAQNRQAQKQLIATIHTWPGPDPDWHAFVIVVITWCEACRLSCSTPVWRCCQAGLPKAVEQSRSDLPV